MYNKMNLGFYKNKTLSIIFLLVCIIGSLAIGNMMKTMEGFQEGATTKTDAKESKLKEDLYKILVNKDIEKEPKKQIKQILLTIGKYLKKNDTNKTVTQAMNILAMNMKHDKKINLISTLITS
jgi:hypothetical protein